ncbi:MAG: hypothetical protein ACEQSR_09060, partial [Candidatus Methylacidiphilales bacterium]
MKKIRSIIIVALTTTLKLSAQSNAVNDDFTNNNTKLIEHKVNSVVSNVTVFNSQAQVTRIAKLNFEGSGIFNIVFAQLSPYIN